MTLSRTGPVGGDSSIGGEHTPQPEFEGLWVQILRETCGDKLGKPDRDTSRSLSPVSRATDSTLWPRLQHATPPPRSPLLTGRNPQRRYISLANRVGTRVGSGCSELPTRSAFSHRHEVNFFNAGGGAGLRGPGDRGPAQGPACRAGSTGDLAWEATAGLGPRGRPWGGRVVAWAPRTGGAEERGQPTLFRPAEDTELRKAPAGMGWLSRGRGKPGPAN